MIQAILKKILPYAKDDEHTKRYTYGVFAGLVGIVINIALFITKFFIGIATNSVAISADAFNNLGDIGSSVLTIMGFKFAALPPDKEHPFGHGRIEYITSLVISMIVMIIGFELLKDSFGRVVSPAVVKFSWITIVALLLSIVAKLWLGCFNKKLGGKIDSEVMNANAFDSYGDVISTSMVVISLVASRFTKIPVDGYIGILVSLFIMYSGFDLIRESADLLIGGKPDPKLVKQIREKLLSYDDIIGMHDLIIHNYGPGRCIVSLHAEIPEEMPVVKAHYLVDTIEREISEELNIAITIHMDPINLNDEEVDKTKEEIIKIISKFPKIHSMHDFRVVGKGEQKNVIFDVVVSFDIKPEEEEEFKDKLATAIKQEYPGYNSVITIDRKYV